MRTQIILALFVLSVTTPGFICKKVNDKKISGCIKGRLEIKGICMNYVIKAVEGDIDLTKIETNWKDPATGKMYENVFALGNPCSFPTDIHEGDEFYYNLIEEDKSECAVCMAYRPIPGKKNLIRVSKTPCP